RAGRLRRGGAQREDPARTAGGAGRDRRRDVLRRASDPVVTLARPRFNTRVTRLFGIEVPIVQGAMAWLSEAELVAAVSNQGGLGVLGASLMSVEEFEVQVKRTKALTDRPFAVNFALVLADFSAHVEMCLAHGVKIVFVSAGSAKSFTPRIKEAGALCVHV